MSEGEDLWYVPVAARKNDRDALGGDDVVDGLLANLHVEVRDYGFLVRL